MKVIPSNAHKAVTLEYVTVSLSALEAAGALVSGIIAGSVALDAFGADSVIEMMSALVVLNRLRSMARGRDPDAAKDHRSHRIIAILFFTLATYVVATASVALARSHHPSENLLGIVVCVASVASMPGLALAKRRTSGDLARDGLAALARLLKADATETALCGLLSLSTLIGVILVAWGGWWWADPIASLVVVYFAIREGRESWNCEPL